MFIWSTCYHFLSSCSIELLVPKPSDLNRFSGKRFENFIKIFSNIIISKSKNEKEIINCCLYWLTQVWRPQKAPCVCAILEINCSRNRTCQSKNLILDIPSRICWWWAEHSFGTAQSTQRLYGRTRRWVAWKNPFTITDQFLQDRLEKRNLEISLNNLTNSKKKQGSDYGRNQKAL